MDQNEVSPLSGEPHGTSREFFSAYALKNTQLSPNGTYLTKCLGGANRGMSVATGI